MGFIFVVLLADADAGSIITPKAPHSTQNERELAYSAYYALIQMQVTRFDKMIISIYRFYGVRLYKQTFRFLELQQL